MFCSIVAAAYIGIATVLPLLLHLQGEPHHTRLQVSTPIRSPLPLPEGKNVEGWLVVPKLKDLAGVPWMPRIPGLDEGPTGFPGGPCYTQYDSCGGHPSFLYTLLTINFW